MMLREPARLLANRFDFCGLEEDAAADLDDAIAEAATRDGRCDLSKGGGAERADWGRDVGQVEDIGGFAAQLEGESLADVEVAKERGVDAAAAGCVKRVLTDGAVGACWPCALLRAGGVGAEGCVEDAELRGADPVFNHRAAGVAVVGDHGPCEAWDQVRAIVGDAITVVVAASGDVEGKA